MMVKMTWAKLLSVDCREASLVGGTTGSGGKAESTPIVAVDLASRKGRCEMTTLVEKYLTTRIAGENLDGGALVGTDSTKVLFDEELEKQRINEGKDGKVGSNGSGRTTRTVQYSVGRGQWLLRGHSTDELVEVGFSGLCGTHSFLEDRSSNNLFEVQRFWAFQQHHNTRDASGLADAALILSKLGSDEETCRHCGQRFRVQDNTSGSCAYHANTDGELGEYKEHGREGLYKWTCCGKTREFAPGCSSRTHMCRDLMLCVRADADAPVLLGGVDLIVLKTLELSVFPSSASELQVQVTRSLVDLLHAYFVLEGVSDTEREDDLAKQQLIGAVPSTHSPMSRDRLSFSKAKGPSSSSGTGAHRDGEVTAPLPTASSSRREGLYVKYLRVGEVTVKVSASGFPIRLNQYRAVVEPFVRHGKVLSWQRLVHKLERHAIWSLTKNTATSWIGSLLRGRQSKGVGDGEEDEEHRRHALLGGR